MTECELCGQCSDWIDGHHVSYADDETILVCRSCHSDIHNTEKYPELTPDVEDLNGYYGVKFQEVNMSKIPSRRGWTKQIKTIPCGRDECATCPHGLYYYYYRRQGDDVRCEYGGKVTESMMANQSRLSEYGEKQTAD
jgi:hypothetical protein